MRVSLLQPNDNSYLAKPDPESAKIPTWPSQMLNLSSQIILIWTKHIFKE